MKGFTDYPDYEILEMGNTLYKGFIGRVDFSEIMKDIWKDFLAKEAMCVRSGKQAIMNFVAIAK